MAFATFEFCSTEMCRCVDASSMAESSGPDSVVDARCSKTSCSVPLKILNDSQFSKCGARAYSKNSVAHSFVYDLLGSWLLADKLAYKYFKKCDCGYSLGK